VQGGIRNAQPTDETPIGLLLAREFSSALFGEQNGPLYRDFADVFVLPSQNENFGNTAARSGRGQHSVVVTEQCPASRRWARSPDW